MCAELRWTAACDVGFTPCNDGPAGRSAQRSLRSQHSRNARFIATSTLEHEHTEDTQAFLSTELGVHSPQRKRSVGANSSLQFCAAVAATAPTLANLMQLYFLYFRTLGARKRCAWQLYCVDCRNNRECG